MKMEVFHLQVRRSKMEGIISCAGQKIEYEQGFFENYVFPEMSKVYTTKQQLSGEHRNI